MASKMLTSRKAAACDGAKLAPRASGVRMVWLSGQARSAQAPVLFRGIGLTVSADSELVRGGQHGFVAP